MNKIVVVDIFLFLSIFLIYIDIHRQMKSPTTKFASTFDVFTDVYKAGNTLHGGYFPMLESRHRSMITSFRFDQEIYLSSSLKSYYIYKKDLIVGYLNHPQLAG